MYGNSQFVVLCVCNLLRGKGKNWITRCKCWAKSRCTVSFTRDLFKLFFFSSLNFVLFVRKFPMRHGETKRMIRQTQKQSRMAAVFRRATNIRSGIYVHDNIGRITRGNNNNRILAIEKRADKSHHTQKQDKLLPNPPSGEFAKTKRDFMYRFSISSSLRKISHGNVPGKRSYPSCQGKCITRFIHENTVGMTIFRLFYFLSSIFLVMSLTHPELKRIRNC